MQKQNIARNRKLSRWWVGGTLCACLTIGCASVNPQIIAADSVAEASNAALPVLVEAYRQEGNRGIDRATTRAEAEAALVTVEATWRPVWDAWSALQSAHGVWASALEAGSQTEAALGVLKSSYCGLIGVWPKSVPAIPLSIISCN